MSDHITENAGYDDSSELHPTVGPDWDAIEVNCGLSLSDEQKVVLENHFEDLAEAYKDEKRLEGLRVVFDWIYNKGRDDARGIAIRTILWMGVLLPEFKPMSQAELATKFGFKKQSMGRWRHGEFAPGEKPYEGESMIERFPFLNLTIDDDETNKT